jgi:hypothetical protein
LDSFFSTFDGADPGDTVIAEEPAVAMSDPHHDGNVVVQEQQLADYAHCSYSRNVDPFQMSALLRSLHENSISTNNSLTLETLKLLRGFMNNRLGYDLRSPGRKAEWQAMYARFQFALVPASPSSAATTQDASSSSSSHHTVEKHMKASPPRIQLLSQFAVRFDASLRNPQTVLSVPEVADMFYPFHQSLSVLSVSHLQYDNMCAVFSFTVGSNYFAMTEKNALVVVSMHHNRKPRTPIDFREFPEVVSQNPMSVYQTKKANSEEYRMMCSAPFMILPPSKVGIGSNTISMRFRPVLPTPDQARFCMLYFAVVRIVKQLSVDDLLLRIPVAGRGECGQSKESTHGDEDVLEVVSKVRINCPISCARIVLPCKGMSCKHRDCFDGKWFLTLARDTGVWQCPLCQHSCMMHELRIDAQMQQLLQSVPEDTEHVYVDAQGWIVENYGTPKKDGGAARKRGIEEVDQSSDTSTTLSAESSSNAKRNLLTTPSVIIIDDDD